MEIAQSMEAATKQSSELHTPSVSVPISQDIQFTTTGKTCYRNVTLEHKNVTVVARKGTLLKYVKHPKNNKTRKIQPSHDLEQLKLQNNTPTL